MSGLPPLTIDRDLRNALIDKKEGESYSIYILENRDVTDVQIRKLSASIDSSENNLIVILIEGTVKNKELIRTISEKVHFIQTLDPFFNKKINCVLEIIDLYDIHPSSSVLRSFSHHSNVFGTISWSCNLLFKAI